MSQAPQRDHPQGRGLPAVDGQRIQLDPSASFGDEVARIADEHNAHVVFCLVE